MITRAPKPFRFGVEYQFDEPGDFYIAIALHDMSRGGITYDSGSKTFRITKPGHHRLEFELPVDQFNDGQFALFTSLRVPNASDPGATDLVAVAIDANSCNFVVRNPRNRQYALLSDRALHFVPVTSTQEEGLDVHDIVVNTPADWKNPHSQQRVDEAQRQRALGELKQIHYDED